MNRIWAWPIFIGLRGS